MNKVYGTIKAYTPYRQDISRHVISYEMTPLEDNIHATWFEVYIYKKQKPNITFDDVKNAILSDINAQTDEKILSGFVWTPEGGEPINVWLSAENQRNFSEAQRMAEKYGDRVLPLRFKLGENAEENPVYHVFETVADLDSFYAEAFAFVNQCLNEGWARKDSINWSDYEVFFPVTSV